MAQASQASSTNPASAYSGTFAFAEVRAHPNFNLRTAPLLLGVFSPFDRERDHWPADHMVLTASQSTAQS